MRKGNTLARGEGVSVLGVEEVEAGVVDDPILGVDDQIVRKTVVMRIDRYYITLLIEYMNRKKGINDKKRGKGPRRRLLSLSLTWMSKGPLSDLISAKSTGSLQLKAENR